MTVKYVFVFNVLSTVEGSRPGVTNLLAIVGRFVIYQRACGPHNVLVIDLLVQNLLKTKKVFISSNEQPIVIIPSGAATVKKWGGGKMTLQLDDDTYGKIPQPARNRALYAFPSS